MKVSELKSSRFLKKEDVGDGTTVTISHVSQENVAQEGAPQELKWCLHFEETDKPLVLNSTNGQIIAKITGSDDSDGWGGKKIELYNDPSVGFGGKLIGGIRVRPVRGNGNGNINKGPSPADALKLAKNSAWTAFKAAHEGESQSELGASLKQCIAAFYGITDPAQVTAAQWNKMRDAKFVPPSNPIEDGEYPLDADEEPPF